MSEINNAVDAVQELAAEATPTPVTFDRISSAKDIKARLDWGEPALTIIDVRDRESFNEERITGAISCPLSEFSEQMDSSLGMTRDIYLYGNSQDDAVQAAQQLDERGYKKVAVIQGGLSAWKAAKGPTEGRKA